MKYYITVLRKYADFDGRARRSEYWYFVLFSTIISMLLTYLELFMAIPYIDTIYSLGVFIPSLAAGVRRIHDVNKSGWFILVPIYNIILLFTEGTHGPNIYGADTKRPEILDEIELIGSN